MLLDEPPASRISFLVGVRAPAAAVLDTGAAAGRPHTYRHHRPMRSDNNLPTHPTAAPVVLRFVETMLARAPTFILVNVIAVPERFLLARLASLGAARGVLSNASIRGHFGRRTVIPGPRRRSCGCRRCATAF